MQQHRPTLVPAIFALLFLAVSCAASARAVHAAECLAKPNAPAPQGEHWYYRTNRATMRQCWYLGPEGGGGQKDATQASEQPASDTPAQLAAPQSARRPTAQQSAQQPKTPEPAAAPAASEANVSAAAAPLPWPEASKLPFVPPATPADSRRAAAISRGGRARADATESSCRGVAAACSVACTRAIVTGRRAGASRGRFRSHLSARDNRAHSACYFRLCVPRHALGGSSQGSQSPATRMAALTDF